MRSRVLTALALLAGVAGAAAYAQTQRPSPAPPSNPYAKPPVVGPPDYGSFPATTPPLAQTQPPALPLADVPFDDLLRQLERMKVQRAELAKREADVVKEVRRRMEKHAETLRRLGHGPEVVPTDYAVPMVTLPAPGPIVDPPRDTELIPTPSGPQRGTPDQTTPHSRRPEPTPPPVPAPQP
jgi:hypothetical protein